MLILGLCLSLHLSYYGCCVRFLSPTCRNNRCYCDQNCYIFNDCCSDVADIGCHMLLFFFYVHAQFYTGSVLCSGLCLESSLVSSLSHINKNFSMVKV